MVFLVLQIILFQINIVVLWQNLLIYLYENLAFFNNYFQIYAVRFKIDLSISFCYERNLRRDFYRNWHEILQKTLKTPNRI